MDQNTYGLRPRTAGELLRQTAVIYRDHFETIIGVAAAILVPAAALQIGFALLIIDSNDIAEIFLLQILGWIIGVGMAAAAMAAVTSATAQIIVNGKTSIVEAFDYALPRTIATVKASYLVYLILSFLAWTFIGIPIALFFAIAWLVTLQVVILEGTGARVALGRSWELTRNNRFRVLGMTIIFAVISGVMMLFFLLPLIALVLRPLVTDTAGAAPGFAWILAGLFWIIGSVLITPLQYLAWTLIYLDLRARNDALPVEQRPDPYSPAPAPVPNMD